jgi:hypothetical protein
MDAFRQFDRSGRGSVFLEEFVLGVLDRLLAIKQNGKLLESIAEDLLSVESRCIELAALIEKIAGSNGANPTITAHNIPNNASNSTTAHNNRFRRFTNNLKCIASIIRSNIRASKLQEHLSALDIPALVQ